MSAEVSFCLLHFKTIMHLNCRDPGPGSRPFPEVQKNKKRPKYSIMKDSLLLFSNLYMREHIKQV